MNEALLFNAKDCEDGTEDDYPTITESQKPMYPFDLQFAVNTFTVWGDEPCGKQINVRKDVFGTGHSQDAKD